MFDQLRTADRGGIIRVPTDVPPAPLKKRVAAAAIDVAGSLAVGLLFGSCVFVEFSGERFYYKDL